jgi:hypothetical protein
MLRSFMMNVVMLSVIYAECHLCWMSFMLNVIYAECHLCWMSFMLNVVMLSVIYAECRYADCHLCWLSFMLNVVMLSVIYNECRLCCVANKLFMLNVIVMSVVMLNVVAHLANRAQLGTIFTTPIFLCKLRMDPISSCYITQGLKGLPRINTPA